jgi:hypothetical protein
MKATPQAPAVNLARAVQCAAHLAVQSSGDGRAGVADVGEGEGAVAGADERHLPVLYLTDE